MGMAQEFLEPMPGFELPRDAQILRWLRQGAWVPSELATQMGLDALGLHGALEGLRAAGFVLPLHPSLGLRLESAPDRLIGDDILSRMRHPWLREVRVFARTASTNDLAMQRGLQGARGPLAIFAEAQTSGRGRFGRAWDSQPGAGIWVSVLVRAWEPVAQWHRMGSVVVLALAQAVERVVPVRVRIKWPNDAWVGGRKVGGILVETGQDGELGPFAVLGVGLNVNQESFPEELRDKACSLRMACGLGVDRTALAAAFLDELGFLLPRMGRGFEGVLEGLRNRSVLLGGAVRLETGGGSVSGVAEDLDGEGRLLVRMPDGEVRICSAGEVSTQAFGLRVCG